MKARQFHQLAGQSNSRFQALMAEGLSAIAENCQVLDDSAEALALANQWRGARVLRTIADEEAGKFLILLDAVRLGRDNQRKLRGQLSRANDHLAKGLYCKASEIRPADFEELQRYLQDQRATLYLDGPNDVDWMFRNQVLANREEVLYVDLVDSEGVIGWLTPARYDAIQMSSIPSAVRLVRSLATLGCCSSAALPLITDVWEGFVPGPKTHWQEVERRVHETIDRLDAGGLIGAGFMPMDGRLIISSWTFPLHSIVLDRIVVSPDELRNRRLAIVERLNRESGGQDHDDEGGERDIPDF